MLTGHANGQIQAGLSYENLHLHFASTVELCSDFLSRPFETGIYYAQENRLGGFKKSNLWLVRSVTLLIFGFILW